ncbi:MAG: nuclear transport factor 2 family protein [Acidimicrobiales bacterium]
MERTEIVAREAIRDLLARYTWAGDRGRSAELASCFLADGVLDVGDHGGRWEGRARIEQELAAVAERVAASGATPTPVSHHVSSVLIEMTGPTSAIVRSYFAVHTDAGLDHWGTYRDEVAQDPIDGHWRFAERRVRVTGSSPESRFGAAR